MVPLIPFLWSKHMGGLLHLNIPPSCEGEAICACYLGTRSIVDIFSVLTSTHADRDDTFFHLFFMSRAQFR